MLASLQKIFDVENYTFWIEGILDRIWDIHTQGRILISSFVKVSNFETPTLKYMKLINKRIYPSMKEIKGNNNSLVV